MRPGARKLVAVAALAIGLVGAGTLAMAPNERAICERMFELARAAGEEPAQLGIDDAACHEAIERRRAKMNPVRRASYGICVVMADTLDEIGRC